MRKKALPSFVCFAVALPVEAIVDPKIAEFCLKAQDFQGCVESMSGDSSAKSIAAMREVQDKVEPMPISATRKPQAQDPNRRRV